MPHSRKSKYDKYVQVFPRRTLAIAPERYIYIVTKPVVQSYVPVSLEGSARIREKRLCKVFRKCKAQYLSHAYRYGGIRSKVTEYLHRIQAGTEQQLISGHIRVAVINLFNAHKFYQTLHLF